MDCLPDSLSDMRRSPLCEIANFEMIWEEGIFHSGPTVPDRNPWVKTRPSMDAVNNKPDGSWEVMALTG